MPRLDGGYAGRARVRSALRATGLVVGILLGAGGVWVLITANSTKDTRVGAVVAAWGLFFALSALFGRRHQDPADVAGEVVVRTMTGLDTLSDARAVREYEQRLQAMLRQEIQQTLGPELASLRAEVASLRSELVEKVGGELRLERIETTRIIGSDIEALQREVQTLKSGLFTDDFDQLRSTAITAGSTIDAEVVDEQPPPVQQHRAPAPAAPPAPAPPAPTPPAQRAPEPFIPPAPATRPAPIPPNELTAPVPSLRAVDPAGQAPASAGHEPMVPGMPEPPPAPERLAAGSYWQTEAERHSAPLPPPPPPAPDYVEAPPPAAPEPVADFAPWRPQTPQTPQTPYVPPPAEPERHAAPQPEPSPPPAMPEPDPNDPFASLPRIRPFTEFDLDPVEAPSTPVSYVSGSATGRHASDPPDPGRVGRRRRDDGDEGDDMLSRILQRERGE